jgi:transposase
VKNSYISIQITQTIAQIELLEQQVKELDELIIDTMKKLNSVIMTFPGIGYIDGAMILGEIGDIRRFSNPRKLLAYAGLDPTVCQSGKFTAKSTKMSKRGSKILRFALINAAWQLTLNDKTFKDYYDLKCSQGLNHYGALGHVAHKLVRVVFKLLKDNVPFVTCEILS